MSPTQASILFDLESPLKPENEWAALAACERGEAQALLCYLDALKFDLPKHVLRILEHQYEQTRITYIYISNLRSTVSGPVDTGKKLTRKDDRGNHGDTPQPALSNGQKP